MTEFGVNLPKGVTVAKELALPAVKGAVPSAASAAPFGPADFAPVCWSPAQTPASTCC